MSIRRTLFGIALGGIAVMAMIPALSFAQQPPQPPAALIYGTASGATTGQSVIAFVRDGSTSTMCGVGQVMNEPGVGRVYAVDVESNVSVAGCGASGRQVRLYFAPLGNTAARFANQSIQLSSEFDDYEVNVTFGNAMSNRMVVPQASRNISN